MSDGLRRFHGHGRGRPEALGRGVHADADEPVPVGPGGLLLKVHYPEGIEAAVAEIRQARPDAVTFNEACGGDAARIARQTGYHLRFSSIIYYGKRLPCIKPAAAGCSATPCSPGRPS